MTDRAGPPASSPAASPRTLATVTLVLGALVLSPLARARGWDSFPLSSYPMFARGNLGSVNELAHALLVLADGTRVPASPSLVGTPEPMVATAIVRGHVTRGTAADLCASVAARARDARAVDAVAVEIATSAFDARRYFSGAPGARAPLERTVHARCEIAR
ncbi:MAG: hypothetical protein KF764_18665 [Labilithrix sp.]|nr:hypothetical protein [Labilithrix sp.]